MLRYITSSDKFIELFRRRRWTYVIKTPIYLKIEF